MNSKPTKTRGEMFAEMHPGAIPFESIGRFIAPCLIDEKYKTADKAVKCARDKSVFNCSVCAREYWNTPHKGKVIKVDDEHTACQMEDNHVFIYNNNGTAVVHVNCTQDMSDDKLRDICKDILRLIALNQGGNIFG